MMTEYGQQWINHLNQEDKTGPSKDQIAKEIFNQIETLFLDPRLERWGREAILVGLVERVGNGVGDLTFEEASEIKETIADVYQYPLR